MIDPEGFEATVLTKLSSIETTLKTTVTHEPRLQKLEGWVSFAKGAWAILAMFITALAGALGIHLRGGK